MSHELGFTQDLTPIATAENLLVIGRKKQLLRANVVAMLPATISTATWSKVLAKAESGDEGRLFTHYTESGRVTIGLLPEHCSRHNSPTRAWAVSRLVRQCRGRSQHIVAVLEEATHAFGTGLAIAKSLPTYSGKSRKKDKVVQVILLGPEGPIEEVGDIQEAAHGVQLAAELVDFPPNVLTTTAFVTRAKHVADEVPGVTCTVISGRELPEQGFGGLWAVGKASSTPPAMVILDWSPPDATQYCAWVGKGIVYDTGGLSIKSKTGMVGMKTDMGGAAAVLGAFQAAVRLNARTRITAILCIAENSVGPDATRPDDVVTMYSGRTVEINNTDAEGRLVLADGLAWVTKTRDPDYVIDMATLTGAQGVATGKLHGAVYCSSEQLENVAVRSGKHCGDLVHPLPYAPELYRKEFTSVVADMRNSVKDRANAQASCAGQFLRNHISDYKGAWLHVDMAGPAVSGGLGTGFGVGLLLNIAKIVE